MASMFEQIDALELSMTDSDIRTLRTAQAYTWRMDNPDKWREIYQRYSHKHNDKTNKTGGSKNDKS